LQAFLNNHARKSSAYGTGLRRAEYRDDTNFRSEFPDRHKSNSCGIRPAGIGVGHKPGLWRYSRTEARPVTINAIPTRGVRGRFLERGITNRGSIRIPRRKARNSITLRRVVLLSAHRARQF